MKTSISTMVASKEFTDAQLADVLGDMAELKQMSGEAVQSLAADSKELQNLVQSATASLGEKLDCEQRDILTELYKMRELLGAVTAENDAAPTDDSNREADKENDDLQACPYCGGRMEIIEVFSVGQIPRHIATLDGIDSS